MAWAQSGKSRRVLLGATLVLLAAAAVGPATGKRSAAAARPSVLVYPTAAPQVTVSRARQLARAFGLSGRPVTTRDTIWVVGGGSSAGRLLLLYRASGAIRYIDRTRFGNPRYASRLPSGSQALRIASRFLQRYGLLPSITALRWSSSVARGAAADNSIAVTFSPSLRGVPITNGQVVVWLGSRGMVVRLDSDFRPLSGRPRTVPLGSPAAARADVADQFGSHGRLKLRLAYRTSELEQPQPYLDPVYEVVDGRGRALALARATSFTPRLSYDGPDPGAAIDGTSKVTLKASAVDGRRPYRFSWVSTIDGRLGSGAVLPVQLSRGQHEIEVTVRDANGSSIAGVVPLAVVGGRAPPSTTLSARRRAAMAGPRNAMTGPRRVSSGEWIQGASGISFRVLRDHTHPLMLDALTMNGVKRVERVYFDQYFYIIGVKNTNDPTNTIYHMSSRKCVPLSDAGEACAGLKKFAVSEGALSLRTDAAGTLLTSEYIAKLPGQLRLFWRYRTDDLYCAQPDPLQNLGQQLLRLGYSRHLGGTCPGIRPEIDWSYETPVGGLSDSQVADFCTQPGGVCDIPPAYYSGGSTAATWEVVDFEAKLFTAVVSPGRVEDAALVQDTSSPCKLAKTAIDKRHQPLLSPRCPPFLTGNDLFVDITPMRLEQSALMARRSGRGDWDNFHLKSGPPPVLPVAFPGCNDVLVAHDADPCIHFHENWLATTPGANQTYSRGQTVTLHIAVFHPSEVSPNDPTGIVNHELLFGRHLVAWHESDAFSDQCGSAGGVDNASRPCQVFTNGLFFTPRD